MNTTFPQDLVLVPVSRWPTTLPSESIEVVRDTPVDRRLPVHVHPGHEAPDVSIVVVTRNALVFTRLCLESLLATPHALAYEVIVVDNGSTDGTVEYLGRLARRDTRVRFICHEHNLGFATATNHGVAMARAAVVVLLNNDTIVTEGWLERLVEHLKRTQVGLVGAVTNRAGNEAEIDVSYRTYGELHRFAGERLRTHAGETFEIRTATMFCAALRREVWDAIGPLDERFEIGMFEDDDYAMRLRRAGYRVVCAEDVFVHHFGQASIGQLGPSRQYGDIFHANRRRWEAKWGVAWHPYERRAKPRYQDLIERIRQFVDEHVPLGVTLAVISKGDINLLMFEGRPAWHFPQGEDGMYAGHYPADSEACIAELERLRAKGAEFLVIPETARWWLQHYARFGEHLLTRYTTLGGQDSPATIVALSGSPAGGHA
jgi:GT2 family glycosyltransferase